MEYVDAGAAEGLGERRKQSKVPENKCAVFQEQQDGPSGRAQGSGKGVWAECSVHMRPFGSWGDLQERLSSG